jgi:hypothetical protein
MAVDQEPDQRLRSAIRNKQLLEFNYQGNDPVVEPHDYGIQNGSSDCFAGKSADEAAAALQEASG